MKPLETGQERCTGCSWGGWRRQQSVPEGEEEALNWSRDAGTQKGMGSAAQPGGPPSAQIILGLPHRWVLPSLCYIVFNT